MGSEFLIVWPDAKLAADLQDALSRTSLGLVPRILTAYPPKEELAALLETEHQNAAAVAIGLTQLDRGVELLRELRSSRGDLLAVVADAVESRESLRAAMRAGATEFLVPPFEPGDLADRFQALAETKVETARGVLSCFMPCQATDGASTVALHVAQALSTKLNRPSLVVDCDIYCSTTAFRLGLERCYTLADAIERIEVVDELWDGLAVKWQGLEVLLPPEIDLYPEQLAVLPRVIESATRHYAFVLADLPPALFPSSREILKRGDMTYLVCTSELTSLHLARRRINQLKASGLSQSRIRLIVNRATSKNAVSTSEIERIVGTPVAWAVDNDYDAVSQAIMKGGLIPRDTDLGDQLYRLARKVAGIEDEEKGKGSRSWSKILGIR